MRLIATFNRQLSFVSVFKVERNKNFWNDVSLTGHKNDHNKHNRKENFFWPKGASKKLKKFAIDWRETE